VTVTFSDVYEIISSSCLPCHTSGGGVTSGMLNMSSQAMAYTNLVGTSGAGVPAAGTACGSSGGLRVNPGSASTSLLWQKVNGKLPGNSAPCGNPMPPGSNAALTQQQVNDIAAWINAGAPNN
jgi:hypothetical protein